MPKAAVKELMLRLPLPESERADELAEWVATQPDLAPTGYASRSSVLREAIRRGLDSLERQRDRKA